MSILELQSLLKAGYSVHFDRYEDNKSLRIRIIKPATKSHWTTDKFIVDLERSDVLKTGMDAIEAREQRNAEKVRDNANPNPAKSAALP